MATLRLFHPKGHDTWTLCSLPIFSNFSISLPCSSSYSRCGNFLLEPFFLAEHKNCEQHTQLVSAVYVFQHAHGDSDLRCVLNLREKKLRLMRCLLNLHCSLKSEEKEVICDEPHRIFNELVYMEILSSHGQQKLHIQMLLQPPPQRLSPFTLIMPLPKHYFSTLLSFFIVSPCFWTTSPACLRLQKTTSVKPPRSQLSVLTPITKLTTFDTSSKLNFQSRLSFVCSHLSCRHKDGAEQRRNCNANEIMRRTQASGTCLASKHLHKTPSNDFVVCFS